MQAAAPKNIDDYINGFPKDIQERLQKIRRIIHKVAPGAAETISYQIPTFKIAGHNLIHFAGFKNHIGVYPFPSTISALDQQLAKYKTGKGTIQFKNTEPLPYDLLKKVVEKRVYDYFNRNRA